MWFVLAGLLLARKAFSTAAQVAYTVHMVFNIKKDSLFTLYYTRDAQLFNECCKTFL
jgi:hypothetical protein